MKEEKEETNKWKNINKKENFHIDDGSCFWKERRVHFLGEICANFLRCKNIVA